MSEPDKGVTVARAKNEGANMLKNIDIDSICALWNHAAWKRRSEDVSGVAGTLEV